MNSLLDRIPEITVTAEAGGVGSAAMPTASKPTATSVVTGRPARTALGRRSFLRTAVVGGGALAVSMLGWVSEKVPAFARPGDRTTLHPTHCMGADRPGDTPCWGRTYISGSFCGSDKRHRTDTENLGSYSKIYSWVVECRGYSGWYWVNEADVLTHCWDGQYYTRNNATGAKAGPYETICKIRIRH